MNDEEQNAETASLFHFTSVYEILLKFIGYATLILVILGYLSEKLQLMLRYAIAWRQDKWMNRVGRLLQLIKNQKILYFNIQIKKFSVSFGAIPKRSFALGKNLNDNAF